MQIQHNFTQGLTLDSNFSQEKKMIFKLSPFILTAVLIVGCAKKADYEEVHKEVEVQTKGSFFTPFSENRAESQAFANESKGEAIKGMSKKYLYVPMTLGTPREVAEANPFYQGDTKLVRMQFSKDGLEVLEVEKDGRFAENALNNTPVLTIPGDHLAFQCKEDANGDCSNEEEENEDVTWNQKNYFKPDYAELNVKEVNFLDLVNIEGNECVIPNGVRLVNYEVKKDEVLNIELEKTYKLNKSWECIRDNYYNDKFSYNSFKVRFFYSLVALDTLASKDYKALNYPLQDHDVYGLFKEEKKQLNAVFDSQREKMIYLANRWNPNKTVLDYYLSASYSKPSNAAILDATMKSMDVMNKNLARAGAKFRLNFIKQTKENEKSPGDLRYNSIVLIDDPLANGLLGYAPSVKNPETGEIVQSHINMYGGVLTSGTRWVYEGAVDIMELQKKDGSKIDSGIKVAASALASDTLPSALGSDNVASTARNHESSVLSSSFVGQDLLVTGHSDDTSHLDGSSVSALRSELKAQSKLKKNFKREFDQLMSGELGIKNELEKRAKIAEGKELGLAFHATHAPEFFPIAGTTKVVFPELLTIPGIIDSKTKILKRWIELNDLQKEKVKEVIMVHRYTTTFVHEMGHSLGLRHNFAGSTDSENFYTDAETSSILGIENAKAAAYSSIMDYGFSEYNELASFGKYDVAALQYSYSGEMQAKNGMGIKVPGNILLDDFKKSHNASIEKGFLEAVAQIGVKETDFDKAYQLIKENVDNPANAEIRPMLVSLLFEADKKIADFKFCTDENAGLSSICNRFDEGSTLVEITKHKIERYKTWYKYRNFRDGKNTFNTYGLPSYVQSRYSEFAFVRDLIEDYEVYAQFFPKEIMENGCSPAQTAQNAVCKDINDRRDALLMAGDFFIEILKTPDLICAVAKKDDDKKIVEFKKLQGIYDSVKYSIDKHLITSCFDEEVKKHLLANTETKPDGSSVAAPLVVVGENGKYLNGFKDTNSEYKYASDRAVRGIWIDKVLAMRMLYNRTSSKSATDRNHMALIDHPAIKAKVENVVKHMVLGKPLANPIPFTMENGNKFIAPYVLGNDYKVEEIERYFGWIKRELGLPNQGEGNLTKAILSQLTVMDLDFDTETEELAYLANNYVSVQRHNTYENLNLSENMRSIVVGRNNYVSSPENSIAYFISGIQETKTELEKIDKKVIAEVLKARTVLAVPSDLTKEELVFWNTEEGYQMAIINLAKAEDEPLPLEAFTGTFGEEAGVTLHKLYLASIESKGVRLEEIVKIKAQNTAAMTTAPADATEEVKKLYAQDLEVLVDFLNGKLSDEVLAFYKTQLKLLPAHQDTVNN